MGKRPLILIAVAVVALIIGVTSGLKAGDQNLPKMAPQEIVDKMIQATAKPASMSGSVIWTSDLGSLSSVVPALRASGDPVLALLAPGSGRVWVKNGRTRLELDQTKGTVTVLDDGSNMRVYSADGAKVADYSVSASNLSAFCGNRLSQLASSASVTLGQQTSIAGRDCYNLTIEPKTVNTLVEDLKIAVDGETFIPLEVEAISKATGRPVFSFQFTKVSFSPIADDAVAFEQGTSASPRGTSGGSGRTTSSGTTTGRANAGKAGVPISLGEASATAGFSPLTAHTGYAALALSDVWVIPKQRIDLETLLHMLQSAADLSTGPTTTGAPPRTGAGGASLSAADLGPAIIQSYGQDFGSIILVEIQVPLNYLVELDKSLSDTKRFVKAKSVNGINIYELSTSVGFIGIWNNGGRLLMAAGSVPEADLLEFITSVH